ncbi:unnamed protein product [Boreogadus saida]
MHGRSVNQGKANSGSLQLCKSKTEEQRFTAEKAAFKKMAAASAALFLKEEQRMAALEMMAAASPGLFLNEEQRMAPTEAALDTPPALLLLGRLPLQEPTHCGKVRPLRRVSAGCLVLTMALLLHLE